MLLFRFHLQHLLAHFSALSLTLSLAICLVFLSASSRKICHKFNSSFSLWGKMKKQLKHKKREGKCLFWSVLYELSALTKTFVLQKNAGRFRGRREHGMALREHQAWEGRCSYSQLRTTEIEPKAHSFSLICTCWGGFPSTAAGRLALLKGVTSFSVNKEELLIKIKCTLGIRSNMVSIWCVFILHEPNSISQAFLQRRPLSGNSAKAARSR